MGVCGEVPRKVQEARGLREVWTTHVKSRMHKGGREARSTEMAQEKMEGSGGLRGSHDPV